jgi:hypothetical protein
VESLDGRFAIDTSAVGTRVKMELNIEPEHA